MIKHNVWSIIIGLLLIVVIFVIIYKMRENFVLTDIVYNPNIITSPTPTADEIILIDKIVNDIEICFNPAYTSSLTTMDLNNLTPNFRNTWKPLIMSKIKDKLNYSQSIEPLMNIYYKNILSTITQAYCSTNNNTYNTFNTLYDNEMNKIVDNLEFLIKKIITVAKMPQKT